MSVIPERIVKMFGPQFAEVLHEELTLVEQGKVEDAVLIKAMMHQMTFSQFMAVAEQRGRSWRVMSALADACLEIQGYGVKYLVATMVEQNLNEAILNKAIPAMLRLQAIEAQYFGNAEVLQMVATAKSKVHYAQSDAIDTFHGRIFRR